MADRVFTGSCPGGGGGGGEAVVADLDPRVFPPELVDEVVAECGRMRCSPRQRGRLRKNIVLLVLEHLGDGSYLSEIVATEDHGRRHDPGVVRVIEYTLKDTTSKTSTGWSPLSAIPVRRPRPSFAALYHQRWEIENTLDEIKTHQGGHRLVLRSRDPDGVEQEVYGFLLVHHALRGVMHHTAHQAGLDPDRISFTRVIKRKMSNWKLKHPHHRNPPRPPDPVPTLVPPLSSAPGLAVPSVCSRPLTTPATDQ